MENNESAATAPQPTGFQVDDLIIGLGQRRLTRGGTSYRMVATVRPPQDRRRPAPGQELPYWIKSEGAAQAGAAPAAATPAASAPTAA